MLNSFGVPGRTVLFDGFGGGDQADLKAAPASVPAFRRIAG
jgi:hypothetical protein